MPRILFTTVGSYGDLHPYLAIGLELRKRGHQVTIATHATFGAKVKFERLGFHPVRPDIPSVANVADLVGDPRGADRVLRLLSSSIRESYQDTLAAAERADTIVTHTQAYAATLAARKLGIPWISTALSPISLPSAHDPPVLAEAPWLIHLRLFGPRFMRLVLRAVDWRSLASVRPILDLEAELGLPQGAHPVFAGRHSPSLVLALFSRCFAEPQPDWPPQTVATGFPFYDRDLGYRNLSRALESFLAEGPAPIVFTLGSVATHAAGNFYSDSLEAVKRLGARAVFLTGAQSQGLPDTLPAGVIAAPYAPFSPLFPHAAVIVQHGGIGTTAQAIRSGRPMLVTPYTFDAADNGARVKRLGAGEVLYQNRYNARRAEQRLRSLLEETSFQKAAAALSGIVCAENGSAAAADAIESRL